MTLAEGLRKKNFSARGYAKRVQVHYCGHMYTYVYVCMYMFLCFEHTYITKGVPCVYTTSLKFACWLIVVLQLSKEHRDYFVAARSGVAAAVRTFMLLWFLLQHLMPLNVYYDYVCVCVCVYVSIN